MDYGQLVMDNEFAGMVKYLLKGIPVTDETLAVDVIHEIGSHGDFLSHEHTMKNMRTEQTHPKLIDRRVREKWEAAGGTDIYQRARDRANEILETHNPEPLPDSVLSTIKDIVKETEEELGIDSGK